MKRRMVHLIRNLRFRKKLILSYVLVAIIPLITLGLFSYHQASSFLMDQEKRNLTEVMQKAADNLNYRFYKFNSIMEFIVMHPRLVEIFNTRYTDMYLEYQDITGTIVPMLNTIKGMDNDIRDIAVCTTNDFPELVGSIRHLDMENKPEWLVEPLSYTQTNWSINDEKVVGTRRLLHKPGSTIENILYLELSDSKLMDSVTGLGGGTFALLATGMNGQVIYAKSGRDLSRLPESVPLLPEEDSLTVSLGEETSLRLRTSVPSANWTLYFYVPRPGVPGSLNSILGATVMLIFACVALIILAVLMFSSVMLRRLDGLNHNMKRVAEGNFDVEIHSDSTDEVGELINGVGQMLSSINALKDEVYRKNILQKQAEIKILQTQINPHFLYNSLSLVNWKAIEIGADDICLLTTHLSKYYRTMLNRGKRIIRVRDELENIRAYIGIQLMMHDNGFETVYEVEEAILDNFMLNFTLQPIVENAIEHGVDRKEDAPGRITVRAARTNGMLRFEVEDNGPGMTREELETVLVSQSPGYGLKNVNERIKLAFGEEFGLELKSTFGEGTVAVVLLPDHIVESREID